MHAEDRTIHFSTELLHGPQKHDQQVLKKLYYDLSQTRFPYDSSEFSAPPQYKFYSRRGSKTQSVAVFLPDRILMLEEWTDLSLADFCEKIREVARLAMPALGIPQFIAQTATIRSTFALTHFDDARVFLLDHACQQADRIGPHFRRPVAVGGLRFVLPETPENPGNFHVIIESFRHSLREVFVEVKAVFPNQRIDVEGMDAASANIQAIRSFISANIFPYLNQYDHPQESLS